MNKSLVRNYGIFIVITLSAGVIIGLLLFQFFIAQSTDM